MSATKDQTLFVKACFGKPVPRVPVWLMRQAGRYLPQYQALKERASFLELCQKPELAAQATLDAARYLDTDAAIIFSDITLPGQAMGLPLTFAPGPRFDNPVRTQQDVQALKVADPKASLAYVMEAIRLTRKDLPNEVSLIGFVGAPMTLAAYMIEGTPSKNWLELKKMAYGAPALFTTLLDKVTAVVTAHAQAQLDAGCDTVQLFDSHAGELAPAEIKRFAFGSAARVVKALKPSGAPIIYFARGIGAHLEAAKETGADVLGLDWNVTLTEARRRLGKTPALMGNLDPTVLFTSRDEIDARVHAILDEHRGQPGFVFNLGHGVLPGTPPEHAKQVIESVRRWS